MEYKYTSRQVARSALPDGERLNKMYLIKSVSSLRATYQIRLLTFKAVTEGKQLVICVPERCRFEDDLAKLIRENARYVVRETY